VPFAFFFLAVFTGGVASILSSSRRLPTSAATGYFFGDFGGFSSFKITSFLLCHFNSIKYIHLFYILFPLTIYKRNEKSFCVSYAGNKRNEIGAVILRHPQGGADLYDMGISLNPSAGRPL
jgi:hypothetical protein